MPTNIEGRLIALEIANKRLTERLSKANQDIAELKQARRATPGLGWGWASSGSSGKPQYVAQMVDIVAGITGAGFPNGTAVIYKLTISGPGGVPILTAIGPATTVYNATRPDLTENAYVPVVQDDSGVWWVTGGYYGYVAAPFNPIPAATGFPWAGGTMGNGTADIYAYTQTSGYVVLGTYSLKNPFIRQINAGSVITVAPLPDSTGYMVMGTY